MVAKADAVMDDAGGPDTRRPRHHPAALRDFITPAVILAILGLAFDAGINYERINDHDARLEKIETRLDSIPERIARVEDTSTLTLQAVQQLQKQAEARK